MIASSTIPKYAFTNSNCPYQYPPTNSSPTPTKTPAQNRNKHPGKTDNPTSPAAEKRIVKSTASVHGDPCLFIAFFKWGARCRNRAKNLWTHSTKGRPVYHTAPPLAAQKIAVP